ncbi:prenyltransferase/squalene oxidase repeat-containing protein [Botrimarina sp.]|uniref:prenyltransferase/squalene oxidase repeat-containing protein n=1 Tax=Botrimarina sp. TaxID=2795802 RepID=UPI0032EF08EC
MALALATNLSAGLTVGQTPEEAAAALIAPADPAIAKGLEYLAEIQLADGSFGDRGRRMGRNPAIVALGGMAFLASGSTPDRGPYGENIERCVDFLCEHTLPSGFIAVDGATSHGPMYGHGFATLFLAEAYGMSPRDDLRDKLTSAVQLIVAAQNPEGGWRYQPTPTDADISVTICQIMALRAARNAGIHVPSATVERCIDYVKRCQTADGGFGYTTQDKRSQFPRSAAGVVALYSAGVYEGDALDAGLAYLDRQLPVGARANRGGHFYYGHYYAVQAMWQAGGGRWATWYPAIRDLLVRSQGIDGSWQDGNGPAYATAMACVILQTPNNVVPIFQR